MKLLMTSIRERFEREIDFVYELRNSHNSTMSKKSARNRLRRINKSYDFLSAYVI